MNLQMADDRLLKDVKWSLIAILLMAACFVATTVFLWNMSRDECYHEIELSASEASSTLRHHLELHEVNLELIADLVSEDIDDCDEELASRLESVCRHQHIDAICVQLPDGTLHSGGSTSPDLAALPAFEDMLDRAPCLSGRFPSVEGSNEWFLYQAVPVHRGDNVVGMLYGFMSLDWLPELFAVDLPYGGQSQLYVVDGDTGDFLMDMWHGELGNLYDGSMGTRTPQRGYDLDAMLSDIRAGGSGYFVFVSRTAGEYFYTRYQPVGVNNWSIQLTVPESVAFARARSVNSAILMLGGAVTALTAAYIVLVVAQYRRRLRAKQLRIRQTEFMIEVQQLLFDAHQQPELVVDALERVAQAVEAEGVLLLALRSGQVCRVSMWRSLGADFQDVFDGDSLERDFPQIYSELARNHSILFYDDNSPSALADGERADMRARQVRSIMITPVLDAGGALYGLLCAVNMAHRWDDCAYLECVARSFMMAMNNMESYRIIREMGVTDMLTGMHNRNCYESALPGYDTVECAQISCIYVDVNGLHELNNEKGHDAGDDMLRHVAQCVRAEFGSEHSYRIGGDEFVVFALDMPPEEVAARVERLRANVEAQGYYLSMGMASQRGEVRDIPKLLNQAEAIMYRAKREFYTKHDRRGRRR